MGANTKIEWAHHTFNPWRGCTKIASGCANCYADSLAKRNPATLGIWGPSGTRVVASESMWKKPLTWNEWARDGICYHCGGKSVRKTPGRCTVCDGTGNIGPYRARIFCASLADVFEDWPNEIRDAAGKIVHRCRAGHYIGLDSVFPHGAECNSGCNRAAHPLTLDDLRRRLFSLIDATPFVDWLLLTKRIKHCRRMWVPYGPNAADGEMEEYRPNVWLGTSIACRADLPNLDELRKCRDLSPVLYVSAEPLIEELGAVELSQIDWLIVGGESGHGARPMHHDWARGLRDQCKEAGVPFFFKQWGEWGVGIKTQLDREQGASQFVPGTYHDFGDDWMALKVGKEKAGRLLDGREHNALPSRRAEVPGVQDEDDAY